MKSELDLAAIAEHLTRGPEGIWIAGPDTAVSYPGHGNESARSVEDGSFWFRHRNRVIAELVRRYPPNGPIFDVGGGNGYVARGLEDAGFETVLIEPGRAGAANARRRGLKHVVCGTVEAAGFRPGVAGGIGLFDVLEHIERDVEFLTTLRPLIAPGGRIYITVPAYQMLWSIDDDLAGHFRRYTAKSLARALTRAGFETEHAGYMFWFLPPPILLLRSIPSRLGLRRSVPQEVTQQEHAGGGGIVRRLVDRVLDWEFGRVRRGRRMPFGGSVIAVGRVEV